MTEFADYKRKRDTKAERFHEAGHAAIADALDPLGQLIAKLTGDGSGKTTVYFSAAANELTKYCVSVAGCMAEAKHQSQHNLDTDLNAIEAFAGELDAKVKTGENAFPVSVPVEGSGLQQAACNLADFSWLGGKDIDVKLLKQAILNVAKLLNSAEVWTNVEVIAEILLNSDYDSKNYRS